ncbi:hypothetical protein MNBD_GAMMA12-150 [hydrothermal vent metagenome]|uniref:FHA domain-containing protein n=1 Tax=hydrothermal vent metagenome TaxID=652676 RepID=A0A3B0YDS9_9ZZZZ
MRLACTVLLWIAGVCQSVFGASFNPKIIDSGVVRIEITLSSGNVITGTGILINRQGYVLTNFHVIKQLIGAKDAKSIVYDGTTKNILKKNFRIVWHTREQDIALLKVSNIDVERHPLIFTDSENIAITKGIRVWSLGFSAASDIGGHKLLMPPLKDGVISIKREMTLSDTSLVTKMYETNATINSGNSGGPLLDNCGFVIGMNQSRPVSTYAQGTFWSIRSIELVKALKKNKVKFYYNKSPCQTKAIVLPLELKPNQWRLFTLLLSISLVLLLGLIFWWKFKTAPSHEGVSQYVRRELSRVLKHRQRSGQSKTGFNVSSNIDSITTQAQAPVLGILIGRGKMKGLQQTIHDKSILVGRGRDVECRIKDERVGRHHLRVGWNNEQCTFFVEDLGSVNGSWLSPEHKLEEYKPYYLQAGIEFYIADPEITLVIELPEPETITSPTSVPHASDKADS